MDNKPVAGTCVCRCTCEENNENGPSQIVDYELEDKNGCSVYKDQTCDINKGDEAGKITDCTSVVTIPDANAVTGGLLIGAFAGALYAFASWATSGGSEERPEEIT